MGNRKLIGLVGAIVLLAGGFSQAGAEGRIQPLDGDQRLAMPPTGREHPETYQPRVPSDGSHPPAVTPFGTPLPPSQLTPPPVLPFNPNRSLMPSPSPPSPLSHPPDPAR